ncbi:MAG: helix-turn-helix transcriptional regulator, partial [Chthoniobacterales bacterium]
LSRKISSSYRALLSLKDYTPRAINEIVLGKRSITIEMSLRFGEFFEQSSEFWHGLQVECDFRAVKKKKNSLVKNIIPARKLMATAP